MNMVDLRCWGTILLFLLSLPVALGVFPTPRTTASALEKHFLGSILNISKTYFSPKKGVGIMSSSLMMNKKSSQGNSSIAESLLQDLNENFSLIVVTSLPKNGESAKIVTNKPGAFIILLDDNQNATRMDDRIRKMRLLWGNSESFYLIVIMQKETTAVNVELASKYILNLLWRVGIVNAVVLSALPSENDTENMPDLGVYGWIPLKDGQSTERILRSVTILDFWKVQAQGNWGFELNAGLYFDKSVKDLKGSVQYYHFSPYPPYVLYHIDGSRGASIYGTGRKVQGNIIQMVSTIATHMNFDVKFIVRRDFIKNGGKTFINIRGPIMMHPGFSPYYDYTHPLFKTGMGWFVPKATKVKQWKSLINIFKPVLWITVLVTYISASATFWAFERFSQQQRDSHRSGFRNIFVAFFETLRSLLGSTSSFRPRNFIPGLFFVCWLFYCILVITAYQSSLVGFLTNPGALPPVHTLEELDNSDLKLYAPLKYDEHIISTGGSMDWLSKLKHKSIIKLTTSPEFGHLLETGGDFAYFHFRAIFKFCFYSEFMYNKRHLLIPLDEHVHDNHYAMAFEKGSLFFKQFSEVVSRLVTSGILDKWLLDLHEDEAKYMIRTKLDDEKVVLTLKHLQSAFYLYVVGLSVSLLAFLAELSVSRIKIRFYHRC